MNAAEADRMLVAERNGGEPVSAEYHLATRAPLAIFGPFSPEILLGCVQTILPVPNWLQPFSPRSQCRSCIVFAAAFINICGSWVVFPHPIAP